MDPAEELVTVWHGAGISRRTLYCNIQRGNLARPGVEADEEFADIDGESLKFAE
jgi:hypothetical protein